MSDDINWKYLEDYQEGSESWLEGEYALGADEIMEIGRRFDPQPWHVDREAAEASHFGGLVAASCHLFSIASWFGSQQSNPAAAIAGLGMDQVQIHAPARAGMVLRSKSRVLEVRPSRSKADRGIVKSRGSLYDQEDSLIFSWVVTFMVLRRPSA